ncbi:MBL fold metallo-hydrolase ['Paenibacillus yunnanensis' Narsing Rao et al. 2020]|uniref:MBL fold metallo-hydrolase n=1 Tax=Paenibacillus tengchongensis TaxID=2608684 RepID=UPI00124E26FC|nr:MBL fold metallo-hydrolase [Paenibacillus tengchongensis]
MFHSRHFTPVPLAEGIYALEATETGGAMSNAGIIDMGGFILVFDTFNTPQAGKDLSEAARQLFGEQPVKYVVNSHWHGDHVRGNQHFTGAVIVSTSRTREMMLKTQPAWLARMQPLLPQLAADLSAVSDKLAAETDTAVRTRLSGERQVLLEIQESIETLTITCPELTYESKLTIRGTKRSVELLSLGQAHTVCDSVLYSPADALIFGGDVIAAYNHPLFQDGDPHSWLGALDRLEALGARTVVPGHGPVSNASCIGAMRQYIHDLLNLIGTLQAAGTDADIAGIPVPDAYRDWKAAGVFTRNLEFLLQEQE